MSVYCQVSNSSTILIYYIIWRTSYQNHTNDQENQFYFQFKMCFYCAFLRIVIDNSVLLGTFDWQIKHLSLPYLITSHA